MSRLQDINEKLKYAEHQYQILMDISYEAKKQKKDPEFLTHTSGDILSLSRECYDYCANDIVDEKIIPYTKNQKLLDLYKKGRLKVYFPFYKKELSNHRNPFYDLATINNNFYSYLLGLTQKIARNDSIPNTLFRYGDILKIKDLVTEKKHNRLIAIESEEDQEILVDSPNFKMIIPIKEQKGWRKFRVRGNSDISKVKEYRFEYINEEISKFCLFAFKSTGIILRDIYQKFF